MSDTCRCGHSETHHGPTGQCARMMFAGFKEGYKELGKCTCTEYVRRKGYFDE